MEATTRFAIDFEAAGSNLEMHPILSMGVCIVPRKRVPLKKLMESYLFYAELPPGDKMGFELEAARVGMSHLECLSPLLSSGLGAYDHKSESFNPAAVMAHMNSVLPPVSQVVRSLRNFVRNYAHQPIEAVTDTLIFDPRRIDELVPGLFGYGGIELRSLYTGLRRNRKAKFSEVLEVDERTRKHHGGEDACFLAQAAQRILYEELNWE